MQSTSTFHEPRLRRHWSLDADGVPFTVKHFETVQKETWEYADALASSETISSATWSSAGPTISGTGVSGTTHYADVTGAGDAKVTIVTSAGRTLVREWRWKASDRSVGDYSA